MTEQAAKAQAVAVRATHEASGLEASGLEASGPEASGLDHDPINVHDKMHAIGRASAPSTASLPRISQPTGV